MLWLPLIVCIAIKTAVADVNCDMCQKNDPDCGTRSCDQECDYCADEAPTANAAATPGQGATTTGAATPGQGATTTAAATPGQGVQATKPKHKAEVDPETQTTQQAAKQAHITTPVEDGARTMTEEALGAQQQAARLTPDAEPTIVAQQTGDAVGAERVQAGAGQMASDLHAESSAGTAAAAGPAAVSQAIVQGAEAPPQYQANVQGAAAPPQPQASVQKEQQAKPATAKEQRAKEAHIQKPNGVKAATETLTTTTTTTKTTTTTARRLMGSSATLFGICISFVIALLTAASLFMIVQ